MWVAGAGLALGVLRRELLREGQRRAAELRDAEHVAVTIAVGPRPAAQPLLEGRRQERARFGVYEELDLEKHGERGRHYIECIRHCLTL